MSKSDVFESDLLKLVFQNTAMAKVGDASGLQPSAAAGSLYVSLHTADPAETGDQTTSETAYTNYARVAVARSSGGWTVSGTAPTQVANAATITFAQCGVTGATLTHWAVGTDSSGAGKRLYSGPLGNQAAELFTAAVNDNITIPGHTLVVDDRVVFTSVPSDVFPTGITEGTIYWVKTGATDVITISATQGGAVVDVTAVGAGMAQKVVTLAVSNGITPSFAAGAIVITEG